MKLQHGAFALLLVALLQPALHAQLVTPIDITFTGTDPLEPGINLGDAANLINESGLSAPLALDGSNLFSVTHAPVSFAAPGNALVSSDPGAPLGDFFAETSTTVTFDIDLGGVFNLTDFVSWGYGFGATNGNSISSVRLDFSTDGGATFDVSQTVDVPLVFGEPAIVSFLPTEADFIQLEVLDNHFAGGAAEGGGDRVGLAEIRFLEDAAAALPFLEINRDTGEVIFNNASTSTIEFAAAGLTSGIGALSPENWTSITGNFDGSTGGDGSVSPDDFIIFSETNFDLSEGTIGTGTLAPGDSINYGPGTWVQSPTEDIGFTYLDANTGEIIPLAVLFTGDVLSDPIQVGDLDFDGDVDTADWPIYRDAFGADLTGLTPAEGFALGDLNGDGVNDVEDFAIFQAAFELNNPGVSFADLVAGVPEPGSLLIAMCGLAAAAAVRRPQTRRFGAAAMILVLGGLLATPTRQASAQIIVPTLVTDNLNADVGIGVDVAALTNSAGLSSPIETGDPIQAALEATHVLGPGVFDSYVSVAVGPTEDFFGANPNPSAVWDLTGGGDTTLGSIVLWQYENDGGTGFAVGNHARTIDLRFNTEAQGSTTFDGPVTTLSLAPALGLPGVAVNSAQGFNIGDLQDFRFVELTITDNHFGDPDGLGVSFGGDRVGLGEIRFGGSDLPGLTLEVNTVTGLIQILGDDSETFDIDFYEIGLTTADPTLDPIAWNSLADQDFEGNGPVTDTGDGWEELGVPSDSQLAEAFLQGSSVIGAGDAINLGAAFDTSVFGAGVDGNLSFSFRTAAGAVITGDVVYITTEAIGGDYNGDGVVDAADYTVWRDSLGESIALIGEDPGAATPGLVDLEDYLFWVANFGATSASAAATAVPEPCSAALLMLSAMGVAGGRRRVSRR